MTRHGDELSVLMKRLSYQGRVYVRSGPLRPTSDGASGVVAAEVHTLFRQLYRKDWRQNASDSTGPAPVQQVEEALDGIDTQRAASLLGRLASRCLVWSDVAFMDSAEAAVVAGQVVELLGTAAQWANSNLNTLVMGLV
ncbi:hypothetical protein [Streptomyces sp. NRRL S-646]|uniref:hypothetical protein n=1 Tax=Streptomyces sp. NRRL S-646 TaxID=1463917 RepID=UPI0004CA9083|nr:hypothetical protein [Streptomyces sp. NRRL S-646]